MIRIKVSEPDSGEWKKWRTACEAATTKAIEDYGKRQPHKFDSELYSGKNYGVRSTFYFNLNREPPFFGKCAYCEDTTRNHDGDVEHYRPKSGVKTMDGNWAEVTIGGEIVSHPGYYWLAYEWTNLLPSCQRCNQYRLDTKSGKANFFPVDGAYATEPSAEATEKPMLINPASRADDDDPARHLSIDSTGVIAARNGSRRGLACRDVFGLNERSLPDDRAEAFESAKNSTLMVLRALSKNPGASNEMEKLQDYSTGKAKFCMAARAGMLEAIKEFEYDLNQQRALEDTAIASVKGVAGGAEGLS